MKKLNIIIVLLLGSLSLSAQSLQRVSPEQVGMDSKKLIYADSVILKAIGNKEIPGAVLAVVKDGKMA